MGKKGSTLVGRARLLDPGGSVQRLAVGVRYPVSSEEKAVIYTTIKGNAIWISLPSMERFRSAITLQTSGGQYSMFVRISYPALLNLQY